MKKVMLVDDARSVRTLFGEIIKQSGYEPILLSNAQEALKTISADNKPDLVVTDINMPGMNGIELTIELRKIVKGLPVLVMSTESDKRLIVEGKNAGVTGWLLKPVNHETFVKQLSKFLA